MSFEIKWQLPEDAKSVTIYHAEKPVEDLSLATKVQLEPDATEYVLQSSEPRYYRLEVQRENSYMRSGWNYCNNRLKFPGVGGDTISLGNTELGILDFDYFDKLFPGVTAAMLDVTNITANIRVTKVVFRGRVLYLLGGNAMAVTVAQLLRNGICNFEHPDEIAAAKARGHKNEDLFTVNGHVYKLRMMRPYPYGEPKTSAQMFSATDKIIWPDSEMAVFCLGWAFSGDNNSENNAVISDNIPYNSMMSGMMRNASLTGALTSTVPAFYSTTRAAAYSASQSQNTWSITNSTAVTCGNLVVEYVGPASS